MKYLTSIISLFVLNIVSITLLLYFSNISRNFEKENLVLKKDIEKIKEQININEIEYNLYNSYGYLKKMQKIYFIEPVTNESSNRIGIVNLEKKNLKNLHTVGIK